MIACYRRAPVAVGKRKEPAFITTVIQWRTRVSSAREGGAIV